MNAVIIARFAVMKHAAQAIDTLRNACVTSARVRAAWLKPAGARPHGDTARTATAPDRSAPTFAARASMLELLRDEERRGADRPAGILVAVEAANNVSRLLVLQVLRAHGAQIVEHEPEDLQESGWSDFDAVVRPARTVQPAVAHDLSAGLAPHAAGCA